MGGLRLLVAGAVALGALGCSADDSGPAPASGTGPGNGTGTGTGSPESSVPTSRATTAVFCQLDNVPARARPGTTPRAAATTVAPAGTTLARWRPGSRPGRPQFYALDGDQVTAAVIVAARAHGWVVTEFHECTGTLPAVVERPVQGEPRSTITPW